MKTTVLAVALNPSLDKTVYVDRFVPGAELRAELVGSQAGGKAVNVARTLRALGIDVGILGISGGKAGRQLEELLNGEALPQDWIRAEGETRTNLTVQEKFSGRVTRILEPGPRVAPVLLRNVRRQFVRRFHSLNAAVFAGSLPPGMSSQFLSGLIRSAREANVLTALDTSGEALRVGIKARPFLVKPNRAEAEGLCGFRIRTRPGLRNALQYLSQYSRMVLISLGPEGLVASDTVRMFWARGPVINPGRTVGCGDATLAGFLAGFLKGCPLEECLCDSIACGIANVGSEVPGDISRRQVKAVRSEIKVERL